MTSDINDVHETILSQGTLTHIVLTVDQWSPSHGYGPREIRDCAHFLQYSCVAKPNGSQEHFRGSKKHFGEFQRVSGAFQGVQWRFRAFRRFLGVSRDLSDVREVAGDPRGLKVDLGDFMAFMRP